MEELAGIMEWMQLCNDEVEGAAVAEPVAAYSGSPKYQDNLLLRESFELAVAVLKYTKRLNSDRRWLTQQIERSGCSVGANAKEAQNAESPKDFIHKMKVALKEADETEYWYNLISATHENGKDPEFIERIHRVMRILTKIISTSKRRLASPPPSANHPIS